jgi:hypothetical protein
MAFYGGTGCVLRSDLPAADNWGASDTQESLFRCQNRYWISPPPMRDDVSERLLVPSPRSWLA